MSSLTEVRAAIKATLEAAMKIKVYDTIESVTVLPAAVVYPEDLDYMVAFRQETVTGFFALYVLVDSASEDVAQRRLDAFVDPFAAGSIPRVLLDAEANIGLADTQCVPMRMSRYGGRFEAAGIDHVGAVIQLQIVMNRGT